MPQSIISGIGIPGDILAFVDLTDPDAIGVSGELLDALAPVDKAVGVAVFWSVAIRLKRGDEISVPSLAKGCKTSETRIANSVRRLVESGFLEVSDTNALRKSPKYNSRRFARNRHRYPDDWPAIARRIKDRAGSRCEACGNAHGPSPYVLTVDHCVDHDPRNCTDENLAALCQRCHLRRHGLRPKPMTKDEAIRRLRTRYLHEQGQLCLLDSAAE